MIILQYNGGAFIRLCDTDSEVVLSERPRGGVVTSFGTE